MTQATQLDPASIQHFSSLLQELTIKMTEMKNELKTELVQKQMEMQNELKTELQQVKNELAQKQNGTKKWI